MSRQRRESRGNVLEESGEAELNRKLRSNVQQSHNSPAARPNCLVYLGASLSGWASGESPTDVHYPPERPDGEPGMWSTYWACGTTLGVGDKQFIHSFIHRKHDENSRNTINSNNNNSQSSSDTKCMENMWLYFGDAGQILFIIQKYGLYVFIFPWVYLNIFWTLAHLGQFCPTNSTPSGVSSHISYPVSGQI